MIEGVVLDRKLAIVPLDIVSAGGKRIRIDVLIDTGFNGELTLSSDLIEDFGLQHTGTRTAELANGEFVECDLFAAKVVWHDGEREISVMRIDAEALIGMELLENSRLTIDVVDNGSVKIQRLDKQNSLSDE